MSETSTTRVIGRSLVGPPMPPLRPYVYNGTDRIKVKPVAAPDEPGCGADGCTGRMHAKGFCVTHYTRYRLHGTPYAPDGRRKENKA